jgi:hypothetical protein
VGFLDAGVPIDGNVTFEKCHYGSYFTDRYLINLVADRYADDIKYFDYDFEKDSHPHF